MPKLYTNLNPQKALIWRLVHRSNLPWILDNGLHCGNGAIHSSDWVSIGNPDLISKRATHLVPIAPGGTLGDYVPFYFTPFSVMMRNIQTGWGGVPKLPSADLILLVSSLPKLAEMGLQFIFTDRHAYYRSAEFFTDLKDLDKIDWPMLQRRDFQRDPDDPVKFERYQAEALVHRHLPIAGLRGIVCHTSQLQSQIEQQVQNRGLGLPVYARPDWYFQ